MSAEDDLKDRIKSIAEYEEVPERSLKILLWIVEESMRKDGKIDDSELYDQLVRMGKPLLEEVPEDGD